MDVGHAQTCGVPPALFLGEFSGRLAHVHVHDNSGQGDEHRPVGEGSIHWQSIAQALVDAGYQGLVADEALNLPAQVRGRERLEALLGLAARVRRNPDPSRRQVAASSAPRPAKKSP